MCNMKKIKKGPGINVVSDKSLTISKVELKSPLKKVSVNNIKLKERDNAL